MAPEPPFCLGPKSPGVAPGENFWSSAKNDGGPVEMASGVPSQECRKRTPFMIITTRGNTRVIPEPFAKSVPLVRRLLVGAGLSVVQEFDVSGAPYFQLGIAARSCTILLVDTPVLLFEAIALDRAAAVFLPVHVVISGDRETSYVHWANPMASSNLRPPAPSKSALEDVCTRVTKALSELPQTPEALVPVQR
jgi:uncharacterized protein (DUF302 family)